MKPGAAQLFTLLIEPCLDSFELLGVLFCVVVMAVFFFGLALAGRTFAELPAWRHLNRPPGNPGRDHVPPQT